MSDSCEPHHDWIAGLLTAFLCCGLVVSYLPQHFRIIHKGSSEGFSPWFLLLGSTSASAALMNILTLQWGVVKCCNVLSFGNCIEMTGGVLMIALQWFLFGIIFVLYIMYYPMHLKYAEPAVNVHDTRPTWTHKQTVVSGDWRLSVVLAALTLVHLAVVFFTTLFLLLTERPVSGWATFLGVSAASLAAMQYLPQLIRTFRIKLVGALSIPMMIMQSPGSAFFVISIALRPGTNWTSWITYAVAGVMQATLLGMCIAWKFRQSRLGIDDFGHPVGHLGDENVGPRIPVVTVDDTAGEETPLLANGRRA